MSNAKSVKITATKIDIDGEQYVVKFNLNSFIALEEECGSVEGALESIQGDIIKDKNGNDVVEDVTDPETGVVTKVPKRKANFKAIRMLLWAGLLAEKPDLTQKEVGNLITFENMNYIMEAVSKTLVASLPQKEEDDGSKN